MIGIECKLINIDDKIDIGDKILYSGPCYNKSNKILSTVDNYFINLPLSIYEIFEINEEDDTVKICVKNTIKVFKKDEYKWINSNNIIILKEKFKRRKTRAK